MWGAARGGARRCAATRAALAAGEGRPARPPSALERGRDIKRALRVLLLVSLFGVWYAGNITFNIYNKQLLRAFSLPVAVSCLYMAVGGALGWLSWRLGLVQQPAFTRAQLMACVPLAVCHALTNTCMLTSLNAVAVSLSHTIRVRPRPATRDADAQAGAMPRDRGREQPDRRPVAGLGKRARASGRGATLACGRLSAARASPAPAQATEPLFVTAAAYFVLHTRPSAALTLSLVPIVVGVSVASATDVSFSWVGCLAALASNLASTARNVYSKQVMSGVRGNIDSVSLLTVVNAMAFVMLVPALLLIDGPTLLDMGWEGIQPIAGLAMLSAVLLQLYQQVSYNILSKVSAVTHSVANCVKRVVVIVSAVIFFRHPVSPINAIGTALALGGVFMYSTQKVRERSALAATKRLQKAYREAWGAATARASMT